MTYKLILYSATITAYRIYDIRQRAQDSGAFFLE